MKRKARIYRRILIQGLYGTAIGSLIPVFVTMSLLANKYLAPTWENWWMVHLDNGFFYLVDLVPIMFGAMMAALAAYQQELIDRKQEYHQSLKLLQEKSGLWKTISEHTPVGYSVLDLELNLVYTNHVCADWIGRSPSEVVGQKCYDTFGNGMICTGCPVMKAILTRTKQTNFHKEITLEGKQFIMEQTAVPVIRNGQVQQVIEIVVDMTERMDYLQNKQEELLDTIDTLVGIIELKDGYTGGHSQRVRRWAVRIAQELDMSQQEINNLDIAACLHDIGKIGIAGLILNKPGNLSIAEYETVKQHPVVGADILSGIPRLEEVSRIIRYHHEQFGGGGYPEGLRGENIPLGSRIITLADAFDAMTSNRVYRRALTQKEAVMELKAGAGKQFDPIIVNVLLGIIEGRKVLKFPERSEKLI